MGISARLGALVWDPATSRALHQHSSWEHVLLFPQEEAPGFPTLLEGP